MVSKLFVSVFVLMTVVGVSFSVTEEDDAAKVVNKEEDNRPVVQEDIKKFLSMLEKIDVDQMLKNHRLMSNNVKCFLNEGPCTAQLREMKSKSVCDTQYYWLYDDFASGIYYYLNLFSGNILWLNHCILCI